MLTNLLLILSLTFTFGCELFQKDTQSKGSFNVVEAFVSADYDRTWRAAQIALSNYPILINNIDAGILETQPIPRYEIWKPVHLSNTPNQGGQFYKLHIKMLKGRVNRRKAVKISIKKVISRKRDFFAKSELIASDQLEEQMLMYRIKRELIMEKKIESLAEKNNQ